MSDWENEEAIAMREQQETTEQLAHCVLCGKKSTGRVEDSDPSAVNAAITSGDMVVTEDRPYGVCFVCAGNVFCTRAIALEWLRPGNALSAMWRIGTLFERIYALQCEPEPRELLGFEGLSRHEVLTDLEAQLDREEERQRTAARNAAILHDANHDCREAQR